MKTFLNSYSKHFEESILQTIGSYCGSIILDNDQYLIRTSLEFVLRNRRYCNVYVKSYIQSKNNEEKSLVFKHPLKKRHWIALKDATYYFQISEQLKSLEKHSSMFLVLNVVRAIIDNLITQDYMLHVKLGINNFF